jgi:hypothetical protein
MPPKKSQGAGSALTVEALASRIQFVRGLRVMLDSDLAALYGVQTKVLVQAVKRNLARFPEDFMFQFSGEEWTNLRSQFVTSSSGHGGRRTAPYAFTEQGVAMLSSVLASERAVAVNIEIMRAFVRLRDLLAGNKELARRFVDLERRLERKLTTHDQAIAGILDAIRQLIYPPLPPKRPIGFVTLAEKKNPTAKKTASTPRPSRVSDNRGSSAYPAIQVFGLRMPDRC